jgi:hypothetical protein
MFYYTEKVVFYLKSELKGIEYDTISSLEKPNSWPHKTNKEYIKGATELCVNNDSDEFFHGHLGDDKEKLIALLEWTNVSFHTNVREKAGELYIKLGLLSLYRVDPILLEIFNECRDFATEEESYKSYCDKYRFTGLPVVHMLNFKKFNTQLKQLRVRGLPDAEEEKLNLIYEKETILLRNANAAVGKQLCHCGCKSSWEYAADESARWIKFLRTHLECAREEDNPRKEFLCIRFLKQAETEE